MYKNHHLNQQYQDFPTMNRNQKTIERLPYNRIANKKSNLNNNNKKFER